MRLKDKVAIVTGAGSGFGEGIARRFAAEGASVLVVDIDKAKGEAVAKSIPGARFAAADVSVAADVKAMTAAALDAFGGIDVMVNNAGVAQRNMPMLEVPEETFDRIYAVNVKGIYLSALNVVPVMRQQGRGVILNIASTAGVRPRPGLTWYNGSKGAAITLTRSMAVELAPDKIRVNAINPVIGLTGLTAEFMGGVDTPEIRKKFVSTIPLGRMSTPDDIASAAVFLCSDESDLITGVCLDVDGGRCV